MTDIKMSEVFGDQLPLYTNNFGGVHSDFIEGFIRLSEEIDYLGNESTVKKIESAIAHAINNYDKLVEENQRLREKLTEIVNEGLDYSQRTGNYITWLQGAIEVLES